VTVPPNHPAARTIIELEIFVPAAAPEAANAPPAEPYLTGCPGQPSSKNLLLREAELKLSNGWFQTALETKLEDFASEMRQWLAKEHPKAPQPGKSAVRNALRDLFNRYKRNA
jgi:hypothetical protein